ncbi:drug/metabolite transporter (DMT)-like permease [Amaricoccus macauensis]|uniref:Drug/metabolite transporter (DMT)-like permease n=1 Tax=Amaricoccus macauensis TaxID=57001 RepID=A0A840ST17_9RHOB|nr:DMT family transporter [Amaricoccus macauensis]MBB5222966.1 drug/metabolite transporter (DMT)-like permease [Amaricoccus macauensis]
MQQVNYTKAGLWMLGAIFSFVLMAISGRAIQVEMNTFELMLYRSTVGFLIVLVALAASPKGFAQIRTSRFDLHLKRNIFHYTGQNLWFFALMLVPLSQLVALEFTNPIWVALLAPFLLGEHLTRARIFGAILGFIGVLVVAQPGSSPLEIGHAAALASAICFALNTIFTKRIMAHDSVLCVTFWMTLIQALLSLGLSAPGGIPLPSLAVMPWIFIVGLTGLTAHYALTSALTYAPATIVAPMEFLRLPLITAVGALLYGEELRVAVFVGAAIIIAGNLVNMRTGKPRIPA